MSDHSSEPEQERPASQMDDVEESLTDDAFRRRAVVGYGFIISFIVTASAGLVMGLEHVLGSGSACSGYGSACTDRATQALLMGWLILAAGFFVGFGLVYWRKQLRWCVVSLLFVPLAFRIYGQWFETFFN